MTNNHNPIINEEDISRWRLLKKRPIPEPGIVFVLSGDGRGLFTIEQGSKGLTNGELLWGKYNTLYTVDVCPHQLDFQRKLPCATDAFDFDAEVKLTYSVSKPELIVKNQIRNVRSFLEPRIENLMRSISRKYDVEESGEAERIINRKLEEEVSEVGFKLNDFTVKLSLEEESRIRIRKKRNIKENVQIKKQELKGELELEQFKQEMQRQKHQFELERRMQQEKFELQLAKQKMDFYGPLIKEGNWHFLASQLANKPEDITVIVEMVQNQQQIDRDEKKQLLQLLIKEGGIEGWQLAGFGKQLVQELTGVPMPALENASNDDLKKLSNVSKKAIEEDDLYDSVPDEFKRDE